MGEYLDMESVRPEYRCSLQLYSRNAGFIPPGVSQRETHKNPPEPSGLVLCEFHVGKTCTGQISH